MSTIATGPPPLAKFLVSRKCIDSARTAEDSKEGEIENPHEVSEAGADLFTRDCFPSPLWDRKSQADSGSNFKVLEFRFLTEPML